MPSILRIINTEKKSKFSGFLLHEIKAENVNWQWTKVNLIQFYQSVWKEYHEEIESMVK